MIDLSYQTQPFVEDIQGLRLSIVHSAHHILFYFESGLDWFKLYTTSYNNKPNPFDCNDLVSFNYLIQQITTGFKLFNTLNQTTPCNKLIYNWEVTAW